MKIQHFEVTYLVLPPIGVESVFFDFVTVPKNKALRSAVPTLGCKYVTINFIIEHYMGCGILKIP